MEWTDITTYEKLDIVTGSIYRVQLVGTNCRDLDVLFHGIFKEFNSCTQCWSLEKVSIGDEFNMRKLHSQGTTTNNNKIGIPIEVIEVINMWHKYECARDVAIGMSTMEHCLEGKASVPALVWFSEGIQVLCISEQVFVYFSFERLHWHDFQRTNTNPTKREILGV